MPPRGVPGLYPEPRPHCSVDSREWRAHPGAVVSSAELGLECPSTEHVRNTTVTQSPAVVGSEGEHRTPERVPGGDSPPFHAAASSGASRSQDGQWLAAGGVHGVMSSLRDRGVAARGQRSAEKTARESRGPQLPAAPEGGCAAPQSSTLSHRPRVHLRRPERGPEISQVHRRQGCPQSSREPSSAPGVSNPGPGRPRPLHLGHMSPAAPSRATGGDSAPEDPGRGTPVSGTPCRPASGRSSPRDTERTPLIQRFLGTYFLAAYG